MSERTPISPMTEQRRKSIVIPAKPADPDAWVHQAAAEEPPKPAEKLGFCRKFSFEVICSMISPYDQR